MIYVGIAYGDENSSRPTGQTKAFEITDPDFALDRLSNVYTGAYLFAEQALAAADALIVEESDGRLVWKNNFMLPPRHYVSGKFFGSFTQKFDDTPANRRTILDCVETANAHNIVVRITHHFETRYPSGWGWASNAVSGHTALKFESDTEQILDNVRMYLSRPNFGGYFMLVF